jgi:hypothetical protein
MKIKKTKAEIKGKNFKDLKSIFVIQFSLLLLLLLF